MPSGFKSEFLVRENFLGDHGCMYIRYKRVFRNFLVKGLSLSLIVNRHIPFFMGDSYKKINRMIDVSKVILAFYNT